MTDLARGARVLGAFTLISRLLGLVREQVFYAALGSGAASAAYLAAFRIPNLLRDLFAEGALTTSFVPAYLRAQKRGREQAFALASRVLTTLTLHLGTVAALGMLFPGPLVRLVGAGFDSPTSVLCGELVRIMMPFLPLISLAVAAMGMLNAEERFRGPALAAPCFNLVAIAGGVAVAGMGWSEQASARTWAVLTLAGGAAQLAVQVPPLRRLGYRWRFRPDLLLRDPDTRHVAFQMAPATLAVSAVQVNVLVSTWFASHQSGAIPWLNAAFRLMQLPLGVFGVAVGTTALTRMSRDAAAAGAGTDSLRDTLVRGLRLVLFLTIPSAVGLALLARPIIGLIYEHGRFHAGDTVETGKALLAYALGLPAYSAVKVLVPAFYALHRPRVPVTASLLAVGLNVLWNCLAFERLGHVGLALGTSVAALLNCLVLVLAFQSSVGSLLRADLLRALLRIGLAAAVMLAALWPMTALLRGQAYALQALLPVLGGAAVYFGAARVLRLDEAGWLRSASSRRPPAPK